MRLFSSPSTSFLHIQALLRHLSSTPNLPSLAQIPKKFRNQAIEQAQAALTDYLHTTKSLPFSYAEIISKNSIHNISEQIISNIPFSPIKFPKCLSRFLRYNPINEFGFFYESIGIDHDDINGYLKPNVHFFSDDSNVLDVACTLDGLGFPWNKLGKLYVEEVSIFERKPEFLSSKFNRLLDIGFSKEQAVGICLGFPFLLKEEKDGLSDDVDDMLDELKRIFVHFELGSFIDGNVDVWYDISRKIRVFYDLGVEKGKIGASIDGSYCIFINYSEKILSEKVELLGKLGVVKPDVGVLLLANPVILSINLDSVLSVEGFLNHFGLTKKEIETLKEKYPYVFGQNKMCNLPNIFRAIDLHQWFLQKLKLGKCDLLVNYALSNPSDGKDDDYAHNSEKCKRLRNYGDYNLSKLEFFHGIGFGENGFTTKLFVDVHGSASDLQERFDFLINEGIEYSKLCKMIFRTPKFLNQELDSLKRKIEFLQQEGLSLNMIEKFPAFLIYNLENWIKPRIRFHVWLTKQGWTSRTYSLASIVGVSHKAFMAHLARIHPKAPQLWLEQCEQKKGLGSES